MKRKPFLVLIFICASMVLISCRPANSLEIAAYANAAYGGAVLIETEKISSDENIYYFKDAEYGFEYRIIIYKKTWDGFLLN